jgi:biopolymer transport protein ExbD
MQYSAQRVRTKTRAAVKRREDNIELEELESGELNLIPYLDMVTNLMLFLLASVTAGILLVQIDTTLPDKAPPSTAPPKTPSTDPNDQPLKLVLAVTREQAVLFSFTGLEGDVQHPKAVYTRTGRVGESCDGAYMCETAECNGVSHTCVASTYDPAPVFDYRKLNKDLVEIVQRRYAGHPRKFDTYQMILQADGSTPFATIASLMSAMRCPLPEINKPPVACILPDESDATKKDPKPIGEKFYDTDRATYDPTKMALFHDILFSTGYE